MKPVVLVTRKLPSAVENRLRRDYQPRLLPRCDFLAFHCVATPQTRKMLNAERIALLPAGREPRDRVA